VILTTLNLTNSPGTLETITYYFRTHFYIPYNLAGAELRLRYYLDDGGIFYLNGQEATRAPMTSISDGYLTLATGTAYGVTVPISDAIVEPALALPAAILPLMNAVNGTGWTNLANATSPHTNSTTGGQGFFRLKNFTGLAHRPPSGEM